ncbi:TetR/AcrR family transcriptional regulator [Actinoplanes aureus]|jgi:AcrR family transcriptional regulator|uniref:TetR/AcrR family transcriptional regulator n=1 Tax=Actinoplanes aureus TaxID=2792083 RepID=A0A931CII7_9ACTN|nr:TetR/AcrR family transcriptional regulator [Actinoplanes aureus]MBG0565555.1 TetR/AcrR family transcriptional regulator [Actinoplanes aureus]
MRKYESLRRATQAAQTRSEIAAAARRLFVARGWAATTVRDVAREAGVSVPTVYAAYGNKTGLIQALAEAADNAADPAQSLAEIEAAADDPVRQLAAMTGYDRRLFERAGDLIRLIREAGRTEPALADAYRAGRRGGDETRIQVFSSWPLRDGLELGTAVDVYAAICNIDVYSTLTVERGWSPDQVERWWIQVLTRELLG